MTTKRKTKGKANKRVKSTHTLVSDVEDTKSSQASHQDSQPASSLGKRKRPAIPDSDDEWVTDDETENGSPVLSHPPTDSDLSDDMMQHYRLLLSEFSDEVTASEDRNTTYDEELKTLNRLCHELPDNLDEANYIPLSDILARFESIIPKVDAHYAKLDGTQIRGTAGPLRYGSIRRLEVFCELDIIYDMMKLHTDAHIVKLEALLARMRVGDKKLSEINWNRRGSLLRTTPPAFYTTYTRGLYGFQTQHQGE
ncbi:hypothetical protein J4E93_009923 [Alternaria ventricosa]|uniref:uncharacterized protein n=1 Tax=Alternaria ventricosa TaxID=1187951 RepID=UPI0020C23FA7|nr:uncharacterized protein J4E93_009923 [Alternaria ventricosa]KAI4638622.1 hypothetical protein J4E93_009923 [Alternaria ventricosa]